VKMFEQFDADKTRMTGLPYGGKTDNMLSRFHLIPACDGQTDGQTDRIAISILRASVQTCDKNQRYRLFTIIGH